MPTGIYQQPDGSFRVIACIGRGKGKRLEKRFPAGTKPKVLLRWQEDAEHDLRERPTAQPGSLLEDVERRYLPIKLATMPKNGYKERTRLMGLWLAELGARRHRADVEPVEIRAALAKWQVGFDWENGSCNRARTALMDFYNVLGGKSGYNPVRDVKRQREFRKPAPKVDYGLLDRILDAMPDQGQGIKGMTRREVSQTKARLCVLAYTGWPHAQIMRLQPEHIDWPGRQVYIEGRRKGEGTEDRWLPVSAAGMVALRLFADAKAWGHFSPSSMRISFQRALKKVDPEKRVTPYKLRHLFGTTVMKSSKNRSATSDLMIHTSEATTKTYTEEAEMLVMREALNAFDEDVVGPRIGRTPKTARPKTVTDVE